MINRLYRGIARRLRRFKRDWRKPVIKGRVRVPIVRPVVLDTIPHDPEAFTQGLAYCKDEDFFYLTGKKWRNIFRVKIS